MSLFAKAKTWARQIKRDVVAVYFAARDPRTPLLIRLVALVVAAYALSPIDLIPDFIPVLGYLDDVLIVPLGIVLVVRMLPDPVVVAARARASTVLEHPQSRIAAFVVVAIWLGCATAGAWWLATLL